MTNCVTTAEPTGRLQRTSRDIAFQANGRLSMPDHLLAWLRDEEATCSTKVQQPRGPGQQCPTRPHSLNCVSDPQ